MISPMMTEEEKQAAQDWFSRYPQTAADLIISGRYAAWLEGFRDGRSATKPTPKVVRGSHATVSDHNGDPACACGYRATPSATVRTVYEAAADVGRHVRTSNES